MPEIRDRAIRTLEFLAKADSMVPDGSGEATDATSDKKLSEPNPSPAGLLTTEIVALAGESVDQRTLTWFGGVLRNSERHGWVERAGTSKGAWQQPPVQRWVITAAGRQHLLEVQERRASRAAAKTRELNEIRRRQRTLKQARRGYDPATATKRYREETVVRLRDAGVMWADIAQVTGKSVQTSRADYERGLLQWPSAISPRVKRVPLDRPVARMSVIAGVIAEETGLEFWQASSVLRVMHMLGFKIDVPPAFRFRTVEDEVDALAASKGITDIAGLEDDLRTIRKFNDDEEDIAEQDAAARQGAGLAC